MFKTISTSQLNELAKNRAAMEDSVIINVCTPAEYTEEHIANSLSIPLDQLPQRIKELKQYKHIYVHCRSGKRSLQASEILSGQLRADIYNVEGGLLNWKENGFATKINTNRLPIIRQVFIAAAVLLWLGLAGFYFMTPWALLLIAGVATGLLISGLTGWCGMAVLLAKMPWNKN